MSDLELRCDCGAVLRTMFADVKLFGEPGPGGAGFSTGAVEVEVCQACGKCKFIIPEEIQRRFFRS